MKKTRSGFTIIELMLAMAFLGTMLLGIATLVMRITDIYQKGLSLRAINSTGREIISDFTRTINSAPTDVAINPDVSSDASGTAVTAKSVAEAHANYFLSVEDEGKQLAGVFCTGAYSYVWNTADNLRSDNDDESRIFRINTSDGKTITPRLARFVDRQRFACAHEPLAADGKTFAPAQNSDYKSSAYTFDLHELASSDDVTELISRDEMDLAIYDLRILPATQNDTTKQIFFSGSFIIATLRGGVNIQSNGDFCSGEGNLDGTDFSLNDFDYCAVNKFNFSARATGEASVKQYGEW